MNDADGAMVNTFFLFRRFVSESLWMTVVELSFSFFLDALMNDNEW